MPEKKQLLALVLLLLPRRSKGNATPTSRGNHARGPPELHEDRAREEAAATAAPTATAAADTGPTAKKNYEPHRVR